MSRRIAVAPPRIATIDNRAVKLPPKGADPFYCSPEWRRLMARLIRERGRQCEECGRVSSAGSLLRIFGDHVVELRDGGAPLDPQNVMLRCGRCHTRKTLAERAKRMSAPAEESGITPGTTQAPPRISPPHRRLPVIA